MPTVVIYHHLSERPDPLVDELGVRTEPELFLRHMRHFAKNYDLVGVADLAGGKPPRRALLVTFDDAYRSVLDVAGPILKSLHAPSVFFLNPGTVRSRSLPIDNTLSLAVGRLGLQAATAQLGLKGLKAASAADLLADHVSSLPLKAVEAFKTRLLAALGATSAEIFGGSRLFMDAAAVRRLPEFGIDVGNHSMSHSFFRSLTRAELHREIVDSRAELEELSGRPVASLSIPYGHEADATASALDVARASGHRSIFLVHDRSNLFRRDRDVWYRTNPHDARPAMLPLRTRVVPMLRTIASRVV